MNHTLRRITLLIPLCLLMKGPAASLPTPPDGNTSIVQAEAMQDGSTPLPDGSPLQLQQRVEDQPLPLPNHPPLDQIPAMPIPEDLDAAASGDLLPSAAGSGLGVWHDSTTGATGWMSPDDLPPEEGFGQSAGYAGADGSQAVIEPLGVPWLMSRVADTAPNPWRMNVKVVLRFELFPGTSTFVSCSGTMRDAETVLTAGHCVYDFFNHQWAKEAWVYPGWDGMGDTVGAPSTIIDHYGYGHGTLFGSWTGWTQLADYNSDLGLIGLNRAVGMLTGWYGQVWGGDCGFHLSQLYHNASYPVEVCSTDESLGAGRDMFFWSGNFDHCPGNRLQIDTSGGCFTTGVGGMSGSGAYFVDGEERLLHAVASTSDRVSYSRYARQWQSWVEWSENTFIAQVRGVSFDLQALDLEAAGQTSLPAGSDLMLTHLAANPTDGGENATWTYRVYLSANDNITSSDRLLSTQSYAWDFAPMSSVRVNMGAVMIPEDLPPGYYWIGVIYDAATDGDPENNTTLEWDALRVTVTSEELPPRPDPMTWDSPPYHSAPGEIAMIATLASDAHAPIEYRFEFAGSPTGGSGGDGSSWQLENSFSDTGLGVNHQYGYRVQSRDALGNASTFSAPAHVFTGIETPSGVAFGTVGASSIQVAALDIPSGLARGDSGLYLQNVSLGTGSGWQQDNGYWTSTGLSPNTRYGFSARARNGDAVETPGSAVYYRYTAAAVPSPGGFGILGRTNIEITWSANGNPDGTLYYAENTTAGTASGWTSERSWNSGGLVCGSAYAFRVKARNADGVETAWVDLGSPSTTDCPPDTDQDGIPDETDNCILKPNGPAIPDAGGNSQLDTDQDGYGNVCDADFNQDGKVNVLDYSIFRSAFLSTSNPDQDLNGDGVVNILDYSVFRRLFLKMPGPSGLVP